MDNQWQSVEALELSHFGRQTQGLLWVSLTVDTVGEIVGLARVVVCWCASMDRQGKPQPLMQATGDGQFCTDPSLETASGRCSKLETAGAGAFCFTVWCVTSEAVFCRNPNVFHYPVSSVTRPPFMQFGNSTCRTFFSLSARFPDQSLRLLSLTRTQSGHHTSSICPFSTALVLQAGANLLPPVRWSFPCRFLSAYDDDLCSQALGICFTNEGTGTSSDLLSFVNCVITGPFLQRNKPTAPIPKSTLKCPLSKKIPRSSLPPLRETLASTITPCPLLTPICSPQRSWRTEPALSRPCLSSCLSTFSATCLHQKMSWQPSRLAQQL